MSNTEEGKRIGRETNNLLIGLFAGSVIASAVFLLAGKGSKDNRMLDSNYQMLPPEVKAFDSSPKDGFFDGAEQYQFLRAYEVKKRE